MGTKKKRNGPAPVPPGNRPHTGPTPEGQVTEGLATEEQIGKDDGAPFNEQDPKRRLGDYGTAGEHPIQQPGQGRGQKD